MSRKKVEGQMSFLETETGLLQNYTGTAVEVWFGINEKYNADTTLLMVKYHVDETEDEIPPTVVENDNCIVEQYSLGKGWATFDGGDTVEDPNRPGRTKFHENSAYAEFIGRLVELGAGEDLAGRGNPLSSQTFLGMRVRYESAKVSYNVKNDETDKWETRTRTRAWPAEWLGFAEAEEAGSETGKAKGKAASKAAADPDPETEF